MSRKFKDPDYQLRLCKVISPACFLLKLRLAFTLVCKHFPSIQVWKKAEKAKQFEEPMVYLCNSILKLTQTGKFKGWQGLWADYFRQPARRQRYLFLMADFTEGSFLQWSKLWSSFDRLTVLITWDKWWAVWQERIELTYVCLVDGRAQRKRVYAFVHPCVKLAVLRRWLAKALIWAQEHLMLGSSYGLKLCRLLSRLNIRYIIKLHGVSLKCHTYMYFFEPLWE